MPRLSIILPAADATTAMEDSLASVLQNRPRDCEVLVVLNRAYDDPYDLGGEVRFVQVPAGCEAVDSVNRAIHISRSPIIHLLPCGLEAAEGWCEAALARFRQPEVAAVTPVVFDRGDADRRLAAGVQMGFGGLLRRIAPLATSQTVLQSNVFADPDCPTVFFRKKDWEEVGGLCDALGPAMAATDLGMAVAHRGRRSVLEPASVLRVAGPPPMAASAFRRGWAGERLYRRWRSGSLAIVRDAVHAAALLADWTSRFWRPAWIAEAAGRMKAVFEGTPAKRAAAAETLPLDHYRPARQPLKKTA